MFRGFGAIVFKEILQLRRDPSTRIVFLIPVLQTIIFGYAIDMDVRHIALAVCDLDRGAESRRLIEQFQNTRIFDVSAEVFSEREVRERIVAGEAKVGLIIPPDFSADRLRGRPARAQALIDGSDSTVATTAQQTAYILGLINTLKIEGISGDSPPVEIRPRVLFNPDLISAHFYIPGLIAIILQIVTTMLTAFAIVRERERGTMEQLSVTPVARSSLILGKLAPYAVIGMCQVLFMLLLLRYLFGVEIQGDVLLLLALSALFLLPALALGILISTVASNQAEALQLSILIILPSVLLSGFAFPRETMPLPIYAISCLVPATYFVQILRGIVLRGAGFSVLWPQTAILAGFAAGLILFSIFRFQKRLD